MIGEMGMGDAREEKPVTYTFELSYTLNEVVELGCYDTT